MSGTELRINEKKKKEECTRIIKAEIDYYLSFRGYTVEQLAIKLGMSRASLYSKMHDVDKFSYGEIRKLCSILALSDDVKLQLIA